VHLFAPITTRWDPGSQAAAWASLRQGLAAFPDRVLFGTEHPAGTGTLATMHDDVGTFGLDPAVAARVLGGNARRLAAAAGAPA
jgi:predicted TIM-barrel fold metal-dependent hydrolase